MTCRCSMKRNCAGMERSRTPEASSLAQFAELFKDKANLEDALRAATSVKPSPLVLTEFAAGQQISDSATFRNAVLLADMLPQVSEELRNNASTALNRCVEGENWAGAFASLELKARKGRKRRAASPTPNYAESMPVANYTEVQLAMELELQFALGWIFRELQALRQLRLQWRDTH